MEVDRLKGKGKDTKGKHGKLGKGKDSKGNGKDSKGYGKDSKGKHDKHGKGKDGKGKHGDRNSANNANKCLYCGKQGHLEEGLQEVQGRSESWSRACGDR